MASRAGQAVFGVERWQATTCDGTTKYLTPKEYLDAMLRNMEQEHHRAHPDELLKRPGFPHLAVLPQEAGYRAPKGHDHWWPAQAQQLLEGYFDGDRHADLPCHDPNTREKWLSREPFK